MSITITVDELKELAKKIEIDEKYCCTCGSHLRLFIIGKPFSSCEDCFVICSKDRKHYTGWKLVDEKVEKVHG